jgi:release factor glutamine methyltransferase
MNARFMGVELLIERGVLVPRSETELLGATALEVASSPSRIVDMCCGSGNLACALAARLPGARIWASDLTDACVSLARRNVEYTGVADRVKVVQGDLFSALRHLHGTIDLIVCNPPYISHAKLAGERAALLENEPREAFDGGPYGLTIHQRVVREALPFLKPGGWLLFEIGAGQERQVRLLIERTRAYQELRTVADAAGEVRVIGARKINTKGN